MTPAFQKLFWFSGLSRYSPMKKVAKMAPMASQTKNPAHPKLLTSGRIVPGEDPEPCSQRHQPSSKTQPNGAKKMIIVFFIYSWSMSLPVPSSETVSHSWFQSKSSHWRAGSEASEGNPAGLSIENRWIIYPAWRRWYCMARCKSSNYPSQHTTLAMHILLGRG